MGGSSKKKKKDELMITTTKKYGDVDDIEKELVSKLSIEERE